MEDDLKFWQLKEWLTIHEASCLALNCDPSNPGYEEPIGWKGFYSALCEAVELDMETDYEYEKAVDIVLSRDNFYDKIYQSLVDRNDKLIFSGANVKGYELGHSEDYGLPQIDEANIKITAIKEWLTLKGIKSPFFFPDEPDQQAVITKSKPKPKPEYQTKLMSIMYDTIKRYYGANYDPNDRDSVPKQTNVIEWIRETYTLSEAEAKAIDKMTRPDQTKSPQGKK